MYTKNTPFPSFVIVLLAFLCATSLPAQECTHPDFATLKSFYTATQGDTWVDNSGWLSDCEPCNWFGVNCDENERVTSLILRGNALIGAMPADLGNLDQLVILNLSYNKIGGELPASLFSAPALRDINLTGNMISGTLPLTVGEQPLLKNLRLSYNLLEGDLPGSLASFLDLEILTLNDNRFTGAIPDGLGDLPQLFALDLSQNDFAGCFPLDLSAFCGQERMRFSGNPKLSWSGDFTAFCVNGLDENQTGAPCDDGLPTTSGDVIGPDCGCGGTLDPLNLTSEEEGEMSIDLGEQSETQAQRTLPGFNTPGRTLSISENTQLTRVYPNPVAGSEITVQLPAGVVAAELRLLSVTGQTVIQAAATGNRTSLALPELEAGIYLVETVTEQGRSVARIMVN